MALKGLLLRAEGSKRGGRTRRVPPAGEYRESTAAPARKLNEEYAQELHPGYHAIAFPRHERNGIRVIPLFSPTATGFDAAHPKTIFMAEVNGHHQQYTIINGSNDKPTVAAFSADLLQALILRQQYEEALAHGDYFTRVPPGIPHEFINDGDAKARLDGVIEQLRILPEPRHRNESPLGMHEVAVAPREIDALPRGLEGYVRIDDALERDILGIAPDASGVHTDVFESRAHGPNKSNYLFVIQQGDRTLAIIPVNTIKPPSIFLRDLLEQAVVKGKMPKGQLPHDIKPDHLLKLLGVGPRQIRLLPLSDEWILPAAERDLSHSGQKVIGFFDPRTGEAKYRSESFATPTSGFVEREPIIRKPGTTKPKDVNEPPVPSKIALQLALEEAFDQRLTTANSRWERANEPNITRQYSMIFVYKVKGHNVYFHYDPVANHKELTLISPAHVPQTIELSSESTLGEAVLIAEGWKALGYKLPKKFPDHPTPRQLIGAMDKEAARQSSLAQPTYADAGELLIPSATPARVVAASSTSRTA